MAGTDDFRLRPEDFSTLGHDLARPECIVATGDGALWVSDNRSALIRIDPDGRQTRVGQVGGAPNGFALGPDGAFWIADIEGGRVLRMDGSGRHTVALDRLDGAPLGSANFVLADSDGTLWITVSTRTVPRSRAIHEVIPDGLLLRLEPPYDRPLRVAEGFRFTNEVRIDAARSYLYVAETAIGAVTRMPLLPGGRAGPPEPFGPRPLFEGAHVDGITFDSAGNLWVTEITRHGLWLLRPDGSAHAVFENPQATVLNFPTSLTFTGPDLRTAVIGSLKADRLVCFRAPVPGLPGAHAAWAVR
jgi:gluconolactonase